MSTDTLTSEIDQLKDAFGDVATSTGSAQQTLIRIESVRLPKGCAPSETPVLLVMQSPRPLIYVKPGIKLPNKRDPRSTSLVQVEGEGWMQFSYSFPYDENSHSLVYFVATALTRFKQTE